MNRFEIRKMIEFVVSLDIGTNPEPAAIFDPLAQGFNVWCIPSDHPGGEWDKIAGEMDAGAFTKRSDYVGTAYYYHLEDVMKISTTAYSLRDRFPKQYTNKTIQNRPDDIKWLKGKVEWVFQQLNMPCPPLQVGDE